MVQPALQDREVTPQLELGDLAAVVAPLGALVAEEVLRPSLELGRIYKGCADMHWKVSTPAIVCHRWPASDGPQTAPGLAPLVSTT
ncbi:hypothetical protein Aple_050920 [Acrocarpospora pleiomorpha]|uniref:Uncharacterized protein n=1 Tax=Acrocarpospora pleiomorpha TaxID=90975 RepID=A0A5M3XLE1_9ACTN|nr:hypothetical protein Aple_050920 [Acrocarpospora pleiomorpha]